MALNSAIAFPLEISKFRGIPINKHPGAFGFDRNYYFHTGVDLYGSEGDEVFTIKRGVVVRNAPFTGVAVNMPWWLPTDAVLIRHESYYLLYGELKSKLQPGDVVDPGTLIGTLLPVVQDDRPEFPGHSRAMLHMEKYSPDYDPTHGWLGWWKDSPRPKWLLDPTPELVGLVLNEEVSLNLLTV